MNFVQTASLAIADCRECLLCRDTYHPKRYSIPMPKRPMEMLMADFLQPEKVSQPGFVVFRDRFSGYTEGRAIEKLDSSEVRQLLIEWMCRFGVPSVFLSDNAESFKANLVMQVLNKFYIFHRKTPVYEPKSNGSVERTIKTIEEGLRIELASGSPPQEAIHTVCGRINRTVSVPSSDRLPFCTPHSVIFNYNEPCPFTPRHPRDLNFEHDLKIGQKVIIRIPNAPKLCPQFNDKIYFVRGIEGHHVYSLTDSDNKPIQFFYRRDRLKPIPDDFQFT